MKYQRYEGESDQALIYRVCSDKERIGTWQDVANLLNEMLGTDYTESKFRKSWKAFADTLEIHQENNATTNEEIENLKEARRELEKEKVKFRDERNEYNRSIRQEARKESFVDLVKNLLSNAKPREIGDFDNNIIDGDNDLIVHVTDIHTGIKIDSFFNKFDEHVLQFRFAKYLDDIMQIQERHNSEDVYVIISEVLSGLIHENLRIENNQNLIEQFLTITEYLTDFLDKLSRRFNTVHVFVCPGNHSRATAKKESSLKGENFDHLVIPYLSAKLQNFKNIEFHNNVIEESIAMFSVRGNVVFAAHGDKDNPKDVVQKLSLLFNMIPKLVYLGHRHNNGMTTVYDTKIIQSGAWCGQDNYAADLRLRTRPEQTISVVNQDGLVCLYDVQLDV